uniref:Ig-like domain-containing protein n=1 Tax=Chelonoidis abingdonii TaxID=106734 RepID=A0A8C0ITU9_CHEAB
MGQFPSHSDWARLSADSGSIAASFTHGSDFNVFFATLRAENINPSTEISDPCHKDVTVTWLRDGQVLTDATRSAPQRNPDGTFNLTLTYTFTPTASDSGSIFSCRVTHMALAQPLQEEFTVRKNGDTSGPS